ncbi:DNA-3-methyladenine glycosylase family protein [Bacillus horti]|uniref:DNA-3-methyladenine glycosylase II n=1 Tax=Caldalkalibacillus horti TaxID=77523 RepID=A0ABT9W133_9BACI|nr:hypothetical protein [Bacillus horti]MDQ0166960.1 DNA-3-methyladenine glycosylase II [Bacillus horti]
MNKSTLENKGFEVFPRAPYDMEKVMLKNGADPHFVLDWEKKKLTFPMRVKERAEEKNWKKTVVSITSLGTVDKPKLFVEIKGEPLSKPGLNWLAQHLTFQFQWESDVLERFYEDMQGNSKLYNVLQEHRGLPLVLDEGIYEGLIKTIIHQQLNLKFAQQLVVSLAHEFGEKLEVDGRDYYFIPTPSQLATVPVEILRTKKFSQRKAEYITGIAQKVSSGELNFDELSSLSNEAFIQQLSKERGIGVWTAECILLYSLARPDLFPAGDLGIRNAVQRLEGLAERQTIEECRLWAKPYERWGSYLSIYLWESLGNNRLKAEEM